ncbi:M24 family metallopeptidase [Paenibacillus agricola]|uniref:Aminopeptidase P family protein n=1 Tax=Paenibacillus agricola TaxID=2716264 RepID=A0ABX0JAS9_9BACL|nr:Xaa-Pro peptidase family protein [Paenibacillus agricola]NHN32673.1 aminopeptidase P family protein [Paenibacillus agricola]
MNERVLALHRVMDQRSLDVIIITQPKHVAYLSGYASEPHERFLGLVLPRAQEPFLLVPALDEEAARAVSSITAIMTHKDTENPYHVLKRAIRSTAKRIGIEKGHLTVARYEQLSAALDSKQWVDINDSLQAMRAIKTTEEIGRLKEAARIVEDVLKDGLKLVKVGITELDIVAELEYRMKKQWGASPSFATTVLSGPNSALPHGVPGLRKIAGGDLLLFDMGVWVDGYASDLTRTFAVGDVGKQFQQVYDIVLEANRLGIAAVCPGTAMKQVDEAARGYIEEQGYGCYFTHRLGHGLGMDVHEYPSINGVNEDLLCEGMVITIEPGIYLKDRGGIRIEDDVLVTQAGAETLTAFTRELTVIG